MPVPATVKGHTELMGNPSAQVTLRCKGKTRAGNPCKRRPMSGATVCQTHGGRAPQVRKKALVRAEVMAWGLTDDLVDPGETLLRLVSQSARRAMHYSQLLQADFEDRHVASLIGTSWGEGGPSGEYIRGLAELESQERDRCARFCKLAIDAGIEAKKVAIAERQVDIMDALLRGVLAELGHDPADPIVQGVVLRRLDELQLG